MVSSLWRSRLPYVFLAAALALFGLKVAYFSARTAPQRVAAATPQQQVLERRSVSLSGQGSQLRVRSSPSEKSNQLGVLQEGALIEVLERGRGWLRIRWGSGASGWVSEKFTRIASNQGSASTPVSTLFGPGMADVQTKALVASPLRYGPGREFEGAGISVPAGRVVSVETATRGWCMVNSSEHMWLDCSALQPPQGGWIDDPSISPEDVKVRVGGRFLTLAEWSRSVPPGADPSMLQATACASQPSGSLVLTPEEDTSLGTVYLKQGAPASGELSYGGWGDTYYTYVRFRFMPESAQQVVKQALLCVFTDQLPKNDPGLALKRVEEPWSGSRLAIDAMPASRSTGISLSPLVSGWNAVDVTDMVKTWWERPDTNFGLMFEPSRTDQTNGHFLSMESPSGKGPRLIVTMSSRGREEGGERERATSAAPRALERANELFGQARYKDALRECARARELGADESSVKSLEEKIERTLALLSGDAG